MLNTTDEIWNRYIMNILSAILYKPELLVAVLSFIFHSDASQIPPDVMANVASLSGISGLNKTNQRAYTLLTYGLKTCTNCRRCHSNLSFA